MKTLTVLGSTGSIGVSTLDVVGQHPEQYRLYALVAGRNFEALANQILRFHPQVAVVESEPILRNLITRLSECALPKSQWPDLLYGSQHYTTVAIAPEVDFVMSAIVGVAGLEATFEAARTGKRIGLANKEVLVASGDLVMQAARASETELLPVDSEHNGIHQCLRAGASQEVEKLILTASGGPFRETPLDRFETVSPAQALRHPTWKMGQRITIDSATMMNKGFEVIEACWLFGVPATKIEVVIHPQSSIHAMVEFTDGSVIAQVSATDMRMPIQYALTYPDRNEAPIPRMDWTQARTWNFYPPDPGKFRCLQLAYDALEAGGSATCTLNAADEIAVQAFLDERISFAAIPRVVEETLQRVPTRTPSNIADVLDIDQASRAIAAKVVASQPAPAAAGLRSGTPVS